MFSGNYWRLTAAVALAASAVASEAAGPLLDPVVTYTNGMRLASSKALRSHNVYWQCDRYRVGYCEGCMYTHCRNELRALGTRPHGVFVPPYAGSQRPTSGSTLHLPDGMEAASGESLGLLPNEEGLGLSLEPAGQETQRAPVAPAAPTGGIWLDTLQTLGRKMMDEGV